MTKQQNVASALDSSPGNEASDAAWHPFNVWRNQVKPAKRMAGSRLLAGNDASASRDWDPYSVWKNQVKGR